MRSVSKHVRLSELTVKIWMKIDLYCQQQRCSPMTLVSANISRLVPIFEGVHWREGVKRQWGNRKHGFSPRLSTIRLRHETNVIIYYYYPRDAMLARVIAIATCLSVCPSRAGIVSKRRKLAAWFLHHLTLVFWRQISSPNSKGFPPNGGPK